ncbi:HdeD family acid-resistance protein [Arthrobacter subterraneus]|uniref:HdeD family acid-resistance protein n=1 Tax=Arthrobacter subterraneus TaxID=335973 RepID=UPI000B876A68|nr:HdeD family acid-resistance protein [Arthrobacter subterraneus]
MSDARAQQLLKGPGTALIIRGSAAVLFGILVVFWPDVSVLALVILFGIYAIVDGVTNMVHYVRRKERRSVWQLVSGVISVLAGLAAFVWPGITALSLTLVIGLWAVILGVSQIALAFEVKKTGGQWWLWLITGIVTIVFGLFLVILPGAGILGLLGLLSCFAVVFGILLIASGSGLHRLGEGPTTRLSMG